MCCLLILRCWFQNSACFAQTHQTLTQNRMHFVTFLLLMTICKIKKSLYSPLISRRTPQGHDSCLNLSQITSNCSILSPFSRAWHYFMPNPDFHFFHYFETFNIWLLLFFEKCIKADAYITWKNYVMRRIYWYVWNHK